MRTWLRGKVTLLFMTLGLLLAVPAVALADATLDTSASLSIDANVPTQVAIGENPFTIDVWAFEGNIPGSKNGELNVVTRYEMSTTGQITPDTSSTTKLDFANINYNSGCNVTPIPKGCPGNPFVVNATLDVASGTPNATKGVLQVSHQPLADSGLVADLNPATGQVEVVVPNNYTFEGFFQPVDNKIRNDAKGGSTIPLKFRIFDSNGVEVTDPSVISSFVQREGCVAGGGDAIEEYASGNTSLRYDTTGGYFIFNWKTPKAPGTCYGVTVSAGSSSLSADFGLK